MGARPVDRRHRPHCHDRPSSRRAQRIRRALDHRGRHRGLLGHPDHPSEHRRTRDGLDPVRGPGHRGPLGHPGHPGPLARPDLPAALGVVASNWGLAAGHLARVRDPCRCFG